jgi:hypothetical protein
VHLVEGRLDLGGRLLAQAGHHLVEDGQLHPGGGERLDGVVQVAGQPPPLLLLGGDELAEQVAPLALDPLQVGDVHGHADHARDPAVGAEQGPVVDIEEDVADRPLGPQLLAGQQPLEVRRRLRLVAAQLHERAPDLLGGGDAEPLEGPALGEAADAVGVVGGQHDGGAGDDRAQPGLAGAQLAGRPVPLGEVLDLAEEALRLAVGAVQQGRADEQVEAGAVGPPAAPLDLEGRLTPSAAAVRPRLASTGSSPGSARSAMVLSSSSASERPRSSQRARLTRRKRPSRPTSAIPMAAWSRPRPRSIPRPPSPHPSTTGRHPRPGRDPTVSDE